MQVTITEEAIYQIPITDVNRYINTDVIPRVTRLAPKYLQYPRKDNLPLLKVQREFKT